VVAGVVFTVVLLLLTRGATGPDEPSRSDDASSSDASLDGILVYPAPTGDGASRLWLWDLAAGRVRRGPLVPDPLELTNVASPGYGWIGLTSTARDGSLEAATLDALGPSARAERVGTGDLITWTRAGGSVVLVEERSGTVGCRRHVRITAVHLDVEGSEVVLDRAICGTVDAIGRTTLGYFAGVVGPAGVDIVGLGYRDAGVLLEDHELLAISPGGELLVAPASRPGDPPRASALVYEQFRGRPVPYVVGGRAFRIAEVLAFSPGSVEALILGGPGRELGLWSVPLQRDGFAVGPVEVTEVGPRASAAYASDGTAFVLVGAQLSVLRGNDLQPLDVPGGAPAPRGPIVWIQREPLTRL
jgi:hypothetical protein